MPPSKKHLSTNPHIRWIQKHGLWKYLRVAWVLYVYPALCALMPREEDVPDDDIYLGRYKTHIRDTDWRKVGVDTFTLGMMSEGDDGVERERVPFIIFGRRVHTYLFVIVGFLLILVLSFLLKLLYYRQ